LKLKTIVILIHIILNISVYAQEVTPEVTAKPEDFADINLGFSEINAYFKTDVYETRLGEPIPVKLIVEMPSGYSIPDWHEDILGEPFQVIDSGEVESRQQGNLQVQEQELTVTVWKLDLLTTDELFLNYQTPTGELFRTPITSITVNVTSSRAENDVTLRPLKPLIDLPYTPPYLYAIPVVLLIIFVFVIRNIQFNRRVQQALATPNSPIQRTVIELKHILDTNAPIEEIYPLIADAIRSYLTNQFHIRAIDMTTLELMTALQANSVFSDSLRNSLSGLLEQADLVKFASHRPAIEPASVVEYAIHWLEQAERARIAYE
jgi:hypothetical protein